MEPNKLNRNSEKFSFVDTVAELAQNREFTKGYDELVKRLQETQGDLDKCLNEKTFLWYSLSALGNLISETIYENVLNYVNNVANINVCKVKALDSICQVLGVNSKNLLKDINNYPPEIIHLIDLFSINHDYLYNKDFLDNPSYIDLYYKTTDEVDAAKISELADDQYAPADTLANSIEKRVFNKEKYEQYVHDTFYNLLVSNIKAKYSNEPDEQYILSNLRGGLNAAITIDRYGKVDEYCISKENLLDTIYVEDIEYFKKKYNIDPSFDTIKIADRIENGLDYIENYNSAQLSAINLVFTFRSQPYTVRSSASRFDINQHASIFNSLLYNYQIFWSDKHRRKNIPPTIFDYSTIAIKDGLTKYAYYKEKKFIDYVLFIDKINSVNILSSYLYLKSSSEYELDKTYREITKGQSEAALVIKPNAATSESIDDYINYDAIENVAKFLTSVSLAIVEIREKLKTQAQRHHMRGTYLLLSYVINEYLKRNLPVNYPWIKQYIQGFINEDPNDINRPDTYSGRRNVDFIEYTDLTEYYNLSTDTTPYALNGNRAVVPFWKDDSVNVAGVGLAINAIEDFYLRVLGLGQEPRLANEYQILSSQQFLSVIYDLGADRSYIDQYSKSLVLTEQVDELDIEAKRNPELSTHVNTLSSYQTELFLKFRGTNIGFRPFYNYKNVTHSSHQIHPYLLKFIERTNSQYAVRNAFYNDANEVVEKALGTPEVSAIIGKCGNILNLWKNDAIDLTGWRSRYETGVHTLATNDKQTSPLTDYDGVFYPSAIEEYIERWTTEQENKNGDSTKKHAFKELLNTVSCRIESKDYIDSLLYHIQYQKDDDYWTTHLSKVLVPANLRASARQLSASYIRLSAMSEDDEGYDVEFSNFSSLSAKIPRTFYDRWYSHLTLSKRNAEYIACQLCAYQGEISALYFQDKDKPPTLSNLVDDIYKYSLDQYGNSILLYKKYYLSNDYDVKLNTTGTLWMRLNSHPIGFPMFGGNFPQAMNTNILISSENDPRGVFRTLSSTVSNDDIEENDYIRSNFNNHKVDDLSVIYDMDFSSDYRHGILFIKDNQNKKFLTIEPLRKYARDAAEFEEPYIYMIRNANASTSEVNLGNINDYEFNSFFRHDNKVYAPLLKYVPSEQKLYGKIVKYPYIAGADTYKTEEASIDLPNVLKIDSKYFGTKKESQFKLGHAGGSSESFKLVFTTKSVENLSALSAVNTYIGESTTEEKLRNDKNDQGNYTELDEIATHKYGIADYAENPKDLKSILREDHIHNSLDSFTQYIGIADFKGFLTDCTDVKLYNLNSDASYIPLYSGLRGMIRIWVDDFYRKRRTQSLELLGYEFKHLSDIESIISSKIYTDDTNGTFTSDDPSDFLYGIGRIYEQYKLSDHFYMELNPAFKSRNAKTGFTDYQYYWNIDSIPSSINTTTISNFYILIFNTQKGAMAPIASCPLTALTLDPVPTSCLTYLSTMTDAEEFFLSNRYLLPYISKVVGTTDVVGEEVNDNNRVQVIGSNNYFNISALTAKLEWNDDHYNLGITFKRLLSKGKDGKCEQEKYINEKFFDDPHPVPGIVDGEYLPGYPEPPYTKELTPPVSPDKYIPAGINENNEGITPYAKLKMGDDYIIDANSFVVMIYDLNLGQYENYHMLYHHDSWPYHNDNRPGIYDSCDYIKPGPPISKHSKITHQNTPPSNPDDPNDHGTISTTRIVELNEAGKAPVLFGIDISDSDIILHNRSLNNNTNPLLSDEIVGTNDPAIQKKIDPITGQQKYVLSNYYDFKEVDYLSGGTIAFKVSEQSDPDLKYPTTLVNSYMFDVLKSTNKNINEISNVFDLSNTYVFELDSPKRIADIIGTVDINIYDDTEQCIRVDESYISDMYSISKFDSDLIPYIHFCTDDVISPNPVSLDLDSGLIQAIKGNLSSQNEVLDKIKSYGYIVRYDEDREGTDDSTTVRYTVTEEDIKNFMKLYVNYERTGDSFTLYFNYNNFIMSPFMYRRKDGSFHPEYKPYTYLKLAPGENGILEVDVQIQYFNEIGLICGVKDIQCLTYKIFNVSDDKPKFVITRTWTLTKSRASVIQAPQKKSKAIMDIGTTYISPSTISAYLNDNYTTDRDLTATVHVAVDSNIEISSLTCDFVYDYSDPYIEFVMNNSRNANFQERGGLIHTNTSLYTDIYLNFKLKKGAAIDEKTFIREIPVDAINFKARDIHGVNANTTVNPGGIIFDFGDGEAYGKYLAKESNTPNLHGDKEGFIPAENDKLIRIFQNKNLRIESRNPEFFKLPR